MKSASLGTLLRAACVVGALCVASGARADVLLSELSTVHVGPAPVEQAFTPSASQSGSVDVTVVDSGFPAPLASLRVAVTSGTSVLKSAVVNGGTPSTVTVTFTATAGTAYVVRVLGQPNSQQGSGVALVTVGPSGSTGAAYLSFSAAFQAPVANSALLPDRAVTIAAGGTITATLSDLVLPAPLASLSAALFQGSQLVASIGPGQNSLSVRSGTYTLRVVAATDPSAKAGLFGLRITDSAGQVAYPNAADPRGVTAIGFPLNSTDVPNPVAGPVTLTLTDLLFPAPLTAVGAVLTAGGTLVARQCSVPCGSALDVPTGSAPAGRLQLWRYALAGTTSGSYLLEVDATSGALYSESQPVDSSAVSGANAAVYTFPFTLAATGNYTARVTDLAAPAGLQSLQFAVFQGGQIVGTPSTVAGSLTFPATAGGAKLVVVAQPPSGGSGLIGAEILTSGSAPISVLATAQAVGQFSGSSTLPVLPAQAGNYDLTLTDLAWPARFQTLNVFVTSGAQIVGKLYGGGTLPVLLPAGNYVVTYSAVPDAAETAGVYSVNMQSSVPTATLTADQASVPSGQGVRLSWSSTGASGCTGSGGWSGSEPTSGSAVAEGPLTQNTTFTLTCAGPGGTSAPASVSVTVTAAASSGGGGRVGLSDLAVLASLFICVTLLRRAGGRVGALRRNAAEGLSL